MRFVRSIPALVLGLWAASSALPVAEAAGPEGGRLLATIRFDRGAELGEQAQKDLLAASKELEGKGDLALFLIGHTDDRGTNASNMELAKKRVDAVRDWLVARGVDGAGIKTASRGEEEPIKVGTTPEIRALNRRVEIWIATKTAEVVATSDRPFAWFSWIHRDVRARKPDAQDWTPAKTKMTLEKLWRVRTEPRSAAEVTFRSSDQLYIGHDALAIILGEDDRAPRTRQKTADVTIEEGALFARLAHSERPITVATKAADVKLASRSARIAHKDAAKATTVAVYEGSADVTAKGKTVPVKGGFGTRVAAGAAPEAPSKLVPPPAWITRGAVTAFSGTPVDLAWRYNDASKAAHLEVSSAAEDGPNRPMEIIEVSGASTSMDLAPGAYVVRPRAVDDRGIPGPTGEPLTILVLDRPTDVAGGSPILIERGSLRLPRPGKVTLTAPADTSIGVGGDQAPVGPTSTATFDTPGTKTLGYRLVRADGRVLGRGTIDVIVDEPPVEKTKTATSAPPRRLATKQKELPAPPRVWHMAQLTGGVQIGPHDAEPMGMLWLGASARLGGSAHIDFGPWVGWYHAGLERPDGEGARVNVFPLHMRAALAFDLGMLRPYFGGSGGLQLVRLTQDARDLGIVAKSVQPGWEVFAGLGLRLGPGRLVLEVDYGKVSLKGDNIGDELGGPAILAGYRFGH
ncbi:OmpA family protein [Myxococcota bacterium]|nr:OmpA family protein [Myxococcota bacterium]